MHRFVSVMLSLLVITGLPVNVGGVVSEMSVQNGGSWGDWGDIVMCPMGMYVTGFSLKVEPSQGSSDDTALNGISLYCASSPTVPIPERQSFFIRSKVGSWGQWTDIIWCTSGFFKAFQLRVEPPQDGDDDTAANNLRLLCGKNWLEGAGTSWGSWGNMSPTCNGKGICGLQTKVEKPQSFLDDTSLNDVHMYCCD